MTEFMLIGNTLIRKDLIRSITEKSFLYQSDQGKFYEYRVTAMDGGIFDVKMTTDDFDKICAQLIGNTMSVP